MNMHFWTRKDHTDRHTAPAGTRLANIASVPAKAMTTAAVLAMTLILASCTSAHPPSDLPAPTSVQNPSATQAAVLATATPTPTSVDNPAPPAAPLALPTATKASSPTPQPVEPATTTPLTPTAPTPEPATATHTSSPAPLAATPSAGPALVIDHTAIADFARIPDEAIARASQLSLLFRGASVGVNMDDGLNCLMNDFPARRPNFCDRGLAPDQVVFDSKYDRGRWQFEPHSPPPNPNPGWWNKVTFFIDRVNSMEPEERPAVVTFTFDYVDVIEGGNMDEIFFQAGRSGDLPIAQDLADLEAAHPDQRFVWWTSNLARSVGTADAESFNQQMRAYAMAQGKILFDMADIESHAPDGAPCFDNRGQGYPAICPDYTDEQEAGHLNARGRLRVAQALWVLMARLAGWEG